MTTGLLEKKGPSSAAGQQQQPQSGGQPPSNPYQDTFRSWVVGVACAWNFFWLTLVNRSSGILFVAILDVFNVSRQEAAWSFSLMDTMASFTSEHPDVTLKIKY